ncbi:hypothetical protein EDB83DRAFT_2227648 [Lactarius deliciosus]|nr:hypothetical protein EDB83DRAFT_2227648 [Lactarius deliciosus]
MPSFHCEFILPFDGVIDIWLRRAVGYEKDTCSYRPMHVANGPGLPARALCKAGRMDPVLSSGETDEFGQSISLGDPPTTLLEVFASDQNIALNWDRYPNVPIYLLQILFIYLAKSLVAIASPFLD